MRFQQVGNLATRAGMGYGTRKLCGQRNQKGLFLFMEFAVLTLPTKRIV